MDVQVIADGEPIMKALGIVRKMDLLDRICIPKEVCKLHGWTRDTPMEMFAVDDGIYMREYKG